MDLQPHPDDHEAKMARADLFKLAQYSFKLFKMIHEDMELEGWVQAKITKSADYIASVYHYMEYEMKFSEYGEKLEQSDMYSSMSESQQRALTNMLTEAKATMKKLTAAQAKKLKKKNGKVDEAAKPDFADLDDDGDEEEPMKKAVDDKWKPAKTSNAFTQTAPYPSFKKKKPFAKKVKEGFPTVDDAKKDHEEREKSKGTGKFDKKDTEKGTQYTRKSSTFTDGGDDSDVKKAKKKAKQTDEGVMDTVKSAAKKVGKAVTGGSDEDQRKDLQRKMGVAQTGKMPAKGNKIGKEGSVPLPPKPTPLKPLSPADEYDYFTGRDKVRGGGGVQQVKEKMSPGKSVPAFAAGGKGKKPDFLDMDKDGDKKEPMKKAVADKKKNPFAKVKEATAKCNHSAKGKSCPVHGLKECGSMAYEGHKG
jgi:hypothetical protein